MHATAVRDRDALHRQACVGLAVPYSSVLRLSALADVSTIARASRSANLEPNLGAPGHAVITSSDAKIDTHANPMEGGVDHRTIGRAKHSNAGEVGVYDAAPTAEGSDVVFQSDFLMAGITTRGTVSAQDRDRRGFVRSAGRTLRAPVGAPGFRTDRGVRAAGTVQLIKPRR